MKIYHPRLFSLLATMTLAILPAVRAEDSSTGDPVKIAAARSAANARPAPEPDRL